MTNDYSEFGTEFQFSLLALYVREPDRALRIIEPAYFSSLVHAEIAGAVKNVYEKQDVNSVRLTPASLWPLVLEQLQQKNTGRNTMKLYKRTVRKVFKVNLSDRDILLEQAHRFAREARSRQALVLAERDINNGNHDRAGKRFLDILAEESKTDRLNPQLPVHPLHRIISDERPADSRDNYLVYPLIPKGGGVLLYGLPKELKSWFGMALAIDASAGRKALGYFDVPHPVKTLLVQVEDPEFVTRDRLRNLTAGQGTRRPFGMLTVIPRCGLNILDPTWAARLEAAVAKCRPRLIVLDVVRRLFRGNVADAQQTAEFLAALDTLRDVHGCAIVLVHHAKKAETEELQTRALGSINLTAWADTLIYTGGKHTMGTASVADVQVETKSTLLEDTDLDIVVDSESFPMVQVLRKGEFQLQFLQEIIRQSEGINQGELQAKSGIPEKRLRELLKEGEERGVWRSKRGNRKELRYYLRENRSSRN